MKFNINPEITAEIYPGFWVSILVFSTVFFLFGFLGYPENIILKVFLVIAQSLLMCYNVTLNRFTVLEILRSNEKN